MQIVCSVSCNKKKRFILVITKADKYTNYTSITPDHCIANFINYVKELKAGYYLWDLIQNIKRLASEKIPILLM